MATVDRLMGVGQSAEIAKRTGFFIYPSPITESTTLKGPGNVFARVSANNATALLDSSFDLGDTVMILPVTTASVAAPSQYIWPTSAGVAYVIEPNRVRVFTKVSVDTWVVSSSV